ncbi:MAG TPA: SURF1 family protein [Bauldia sp.]|nr:SURF1 family protein [Bauldia sp.]
MNARVSSGPPKARGTAPRRRSLVAPAIATAIGFAILLGLGIWQLDRLVWKQALIARVSAGLAADPVEAPGPAAWPSLDLAVAEYRPVEVSGVYDHAREIHVVYALNAPKGPLGGLGYQVFTPLRTDGGWWVYVNRGFVPSQRKDPATRSDGQIDGETTVVGLLRAPSHRSWFTPGDDPGRNEWFSRDPALFAAAAGLPTETVAPYLIDARFDPELPGGLPQGGETIVSFPNNHLQYALTWFGLAAVLAAVFLAFAARHLRDEGGAV